MGVTGKVIYFLLIILGATAFLGPSNFRLKPALVCPLSGSSENEIDSMKIDLSKLNQSERDRLEFIQKLTNEADEFAKQAGFNIGGVEMVDKEAIDTNYSGQSELEKVVASERNLNDLTKRPFLAIGDSLALYLFAAIGRNNHAEDLSILDTLYTASPFIISWLTISPFLGSFSKDATASRGSAAFQILPAWAASMPVAICIRGLLKGSVPPTPFIIVSMVSTGVILALWRAIFVYLFGETGDSEYRKGGALEVFKMIGALVRRW